jgi:hypothetical protein
VRLGVPGFVATRGMASAAMPCPCASGLIARDENVHPIFCPGCL